MPRVARFRCRRMRQSIRGARSVAAACKPPMLVTRAPLTACALFVFQQLPASLYRGWGKRMPPWGSGLGQAHAPMSSGAPVALRVPAVRWPAAAPAAPALLIAPTNPHTHAHTKTHAHAETYNHTHTHTHGSEAHHPEARGTPSLHNSPAIPPSQIVPAQISRHRAHSQIAAMKRRPKESRLNPGTPPWRESARRNTHCCYFFLQH